MLRPPAPTGFSPAEFLERYEQDRLGTLGSAVRQHGPVVQLAEDTVLVNDPAAAQEVLRRTNTDFLVTSTIRRDEVSGVRDDPATQEWMRGRRATQRGMSPDPLREHRRWLTSAADALCRQWRTAGDIADPLLSLEQLTARSFTTYCFGSRDAGPVPGHTAELLASITPLIASPFQLPRALRRFLPRYRRSVRAQSALEDELRSALARPGSGGLVDALTASGLGTEAVVRILVSSGLASYRVPAAAVTWCLVALADHPRTADECAHALHSAEEGSVPEYVRWTLAETLRLWPPNWLIVRTARGEQEAAGWRIPEGAAVLISPYVLHRSTATFGDDADRFRPERWQDLKPEAGTYMPYGMGTRWCVGKALADVELSTLVSVLAGSLRFTVTGMATRPDVRTTLLPAGLTMSVTAR
ncbi:cytochrome P450 [Streptomyces spirodelae]|uniref:Cytochrome P450 n=1 Tax=Streptomyces spirodelae TaxID=2812904 RepID=A0ABS3WWB2_9ACTN|nr:cytochrome P450 [Streptomyces spirodelae]MBO8187397.1 cytochrome P450 [Streptomyces spirodelae]